MKFILGAITVALYMSAAYADERFDFKGVPLGATEQQLLEKHSAFNCRDTATEKERFCSLLKANNGTYAGVRASVGIEFHSGTLAGVGIFFDSKNFDDVNAALIVKYGQPTTKITESLSNAMGAKFENKINSWERNDDILYIKKFDGSITEASVNISSKESAEYAKNRKKIEIKNKSGDL